MRKLALVLLALAIAGCGSAKADTSTYSGAKVYLSGTQTPASYTWTPVTFNSEEWDTDAYWSSSAPTYVTVPRSGHYSFYFSATISAASVGWACAFRVNGTGTGHSPLTNPTLSRPIMHNHNDGNASQIFGQTTLQLSAGDRVQVMAYLYVSAVMGTSLPDYPEDSPTLIVQFLG